MLSVPLATPEPVKDWSLMSLNRRTVATARYSQGVKRSICHVFDPIHGRGASR
jgi:hypothetical protein